MRPWWKSRAVTVAAGIAIGLLGVALPPAAGFTTPIAVGLAMWAMRHPADNQPRPDERPRDGGWARLVAMVALLICVFLVLLAMVLGFLPVPEVRR